MSLDIFHLSEQIFTAYLLLCGRVIGLFATMPLFGERTVPWQPKVGISMITAFLLLPIAQAHLPLPARSFLELGLQLARELSVGILIGYLARLLFGAFQFAVNAVDFQVGLSFIQIVSPGTGANMSVLGQLLNTMMLLLFLELDGHHILLRALAQTVGSIPLGTAMPGPEMAFGIIRLFSVFVAVSFQIALPTVMILLLIDLAMGVVGRVVPQLNVFLVALPVKIMIGLATIAITLPTVAALLGRLLQVLSHDLTELLGMLR